MNAHDRTEPGGDAITARLFDHEGGQAVRLPDGMRFATAEVRVRREGDRVILEPAGDDEEAGAERTGTAAFDVDAWWSTLQSFNDVDFPSIAEEDSNAPHRPVDNLD